MVGRTKGWLNPTRPVICFYVLICNLSFFTFFQNATVNLLAQWRMKQPAHSMQRTTSPLVSVVAKRMWKGEHVTCVSTNTMACCSMKLRVLVKVSVNIIYQVLGLNRELTRVGFEPTTSGLTCRTNDLRLVRIPL